MLQLPVSQTLRAQLNMLDTRAGMLNVKGFVSDHSKRFGLQGRGCKRSTLNLRREGGLADQAS